MQTTYGYVRVSSLKQNVTHQIIAMREYGVADDHIVIEKKSGKNFQRPLYQAMIEQMQPKDVLVIQSIDRLGRSYQEVLCQWRKLTQVRQLDVVVLDAAAILDTRKRRDLVDTLLTDLTLQILSYASEQEYIDIHKRQKEGILAAKERGVKFGRKKLKMPPAFKKTFPVLGNSFRHISGYTVL